MCTRRPKRNRTQRLTSSNRVVLEYPFDGDDIESNRSIITLTQNDVRLLKNSSFLNDTIISFFIQYHIDKKIDPEVRSRIYVFNNFFFSKIKSLRNQQNDDEGLKCASRWLKGVDIFSKDFLIMPVCEQDHWLLIIICYPANVPKFSNRSLHNDELYEPAVFVLNSFQGLAPSLKKTLNRFLSHEWMRQRNSIRIFSIQQAKRHGIRLVFPDLPQQSNNYNCGVYLLNYLHCFLKNPREAYIRMFRHRDLRQWFYENKINITRERTRMDNELKTLIKKYNDELKRKGSSQASQEVIIGSPTHSSQESDNDEANQVIVIN